MPDKIYINCKPQCPIGFFALKNEKIQGLNYNIEYINKDALIDKLYKWFEEDTTVADYYTKESFKKVIDNMEKVKWHDCNKEKPDIYKPVVILFAENLYIRYFTEDDVNRIILWDKWAYACDILPEGN